MQYDAEEHYARRAWLRTSYPIVSVFYRNEYAKCVERMKAIRQEADAQGIAIKVSEWESVSQKK